MKKFTELRFEEWIEQSLLKVGYTNSFIHSNENEHLYDKQYCLLTGELLGFIKETQSEMYSRLENQFGDSTDTHLISLIHKTFSDTKRIGIISLLRDGLTTRDCHFHFVYFEPKSNLNPEHLSLYHKNRFTIVRQLHYSTHNKNSLDMVLFLNGFPIVTMELKNQLTGQNRTHSEKQYQFNRDPKETLFQFKRCLVHFCVDNDTVSMTTELKGGNTKFLPYNEDVVNKIRSNDYRTEYLWNNILTPPSLLDIIENFVVVSKDTSKFWNKEKGGLEEKKSDSLVFPRFHQLEVIRKLKKTIREEGVGRKYLIQHTTGSGKSYSIGWLSHTLTSLYQKDGDTKRMFDTILILTDRKVLDKQLQGTVSKLERERGIVHNVEYTSQQLKEFLESGKDIIITTIQKFPQISEDISKLKSKTFGVIIDEVHSSQTGETSKHIKTTLSNRDQNEEEEELSLDDLILQEIENRGNQSHISYFGFTGTPKNKTLEIFGRKGEDGKFYPFHLYSMKQSLFENYTLDVLSNYTTYKRYFKLRGKGEEDKELPEGKVVKELIRWVDSRPITIQEKVSIILNHFSTKSSKKINGTSKGMVVVSSRLHCVLYQKEMVKQMKEMGLPYSCLVGFSGTIEDKKTKIIYTEDILNKENGMSGSNIPEGLKNPQYRILIVSNKFQTGYDEPLLHSMYIDKKLNGVQCVQTLSRLNRRTSGKEDTFVLDFVNQTEDIVQSFQPYYTSTILSGETDPDKLHEILYSIHSYNLYNSTELEEFCVEYYRKTKSDQLIQSYLGWVKDRFMVLTEDEKEDYKSKIQSFIRLYSFISQIINFKQISWEKNYIFLGFVNKILPKRDIEKISLIDLVDIESLRIQKISESKLELEDTDGIIDPMGNSENKKTIEDEHEFLSEIIKQINSIHGIIFKEEDKVDIERLFNKLNQDTKVSKVINGNNSMDNKKDFVSNYLYDSMTDYYTDRFDFYQKVIDEKVFPEVVNLLFKKLMKEIGRTQNPNK
jgi:type I restriction enzyme R subunit